MQSSASDSRQLRRFLLTAAGLYLIWFFGYERWLKPTGQLDEALSLNMAAVSAAALRGVGLEAGATERVVLLAGRPAVWVGDPCNGLVLYALFAGFVLAFPGGGWRRKLPFMAAGMAAIYALNVLRVGALALNHQYARATVDFNHHYTFSFVVYGCIFLLWMIWIRRFAAPTSPVRA